MFSNRLGLVITLAEPHGRENELFAFRMPKNSFSDGLTAATAYNRNSRVGVRGEQMADLRLYLTQEGWQPTATFEAARLYCSVMREGEEHYHLIAAGEVYLSRGTEICCINCAIVRGILSNSRPTLLSPREPIIHFSGDPE